MLQVATTIFPGDRRLEGRRPGGGGRPTEAEERE